MGVKHGYSFDRVYQGYLDWFRDKAAAAAKPKDQEGLLGYQLCNEDVFEGDGFLLNRVFFFVPLLPSESKSGRLEVFTASELNLLQKADGAAGEDFEKITPVEYTLHIG